MPPPPSTAHRAPPLSIIPGQSLNTSTFYPPRPRQRTLHPPSGAGESPRFLMAPLKKSYVAATAPSPATPQVPASSQAPPQPQLENNTTKSTFTTTPTTNLINGSSPPPPPPPQSNPLNSQYSTWTPDIFSPQFVPASLLSLNSLPATFSHTFPPPSINFSDFIHSFAGSSFLTPINTLQDVTTPTWLSPPPTPAGSPTVFAASPSPINYAPFWTAELKKEIRTLDGHMKGFNLYNVSLYPNTPNPVDDPLWRMEVPGIREGTPSVGLGDCVRLRAVRSGGWVGGNGSVNANGYGVGQGGPGFSGTEYVAYVFGMDRKEGVVVVRADGIWVEGQQGYGGPGVIMVNVIWGAQEKVWEGMRRCVKEVGEEMGGEVEKEREEGGGSRGRNLSRNSRGWMRKMLFPEEKDGVMQREWNPAAFRRSWFDRELNYEQQKAVDSILRQDYGSIPFLVSGPPGTGKTKTMVETALQLIYTPRHPKHHILLCAPSHEAADTLAIRLSRHFNPSALFRLQSPSRNFSEVPASLLPYTYTESNIFTLPAWKKLMQFRIIVCTCRDADILIRARCTNRDLGRWEKSILDSLRGVREADPSADFVEVGERVKCHWTALLLDEAAQGVEPECLIPLRVVEPPSESSSDTPAVIMAGDWRQLGPHTLSRGAIEISLFERLFSRGCYSHHPLSRSLTGDSNPTTISRNQALLPYLRPAFSHLLHNYRSHPSILAIPSFLFYSDSLLPSASPALTSLLTSSPTFPSLFTSPHSIPIQFFPNPTLDCTSDPSTNLLWLNPGEAARALEIVNLLLGFTTPSSASPLLAQTDIAILSPFREQVKRLRATFRAAGLHDVNIGPVEAFQGGEHRVVIVCTTRARERFVAGDKERGVGVIGFPKRWNVAMTRAQAGMVVIGNPWILAEDEAWRSWLGMAYRLGCVTMPESSQTVAAKEKGQSRPVEEWSPEPDKDLCRRQEQASKAKEKGTKPTRRRKAKKQPKEVPTIGVFERSLRLKEKVEKEGFQGEKVFGRGRGILGGNYDQGDTGMEIWGRVAEGMVAEQDGWDEGEEDGDEEGNEKNRYRGNAEEEEGEWEEHEGFI